MHLLGKAMIRLHRPFEIACRPLPDYDDIVRAATKIAGGALAYDRQVQLSDILGYLPDGRWECEDCGYPLPDSEAVRTAAPCSRVVHALTRTRRSAGSASN
jgi:hypothetical protein